MTRSAIALAIVMVACEAGTGPLGPLETSDAATPAGVSRPGTDAGPVDGAADRCVYRDDDGGMLRHPPPRCG